MLKVKVRPRLALRIGPFLRPSQQQASRCFFSLSEIRPGHRTHRPLPVRFASWDRLTHPEDQGVVQPRVTAEVVLQAFPRLELPRVESVRAAWPAALAKADGTVRLERLANRLRAWASEVPGIDIDRLVGHAPTLLRLHHKTIPAKVSLLRSLVQSDDITAMVNIQPALLVADLDNKLPERLHSLTMMLPGLDIRALVMEEPELLLQSTKKATSAKVQLVQKHMLKSLQLTAAETMQVIGHRPSLLLCARVRIDRLALLQHWIDADASDAPTIQGQSETKLERIARRAGLLIGLNYNQYETFRRSCPLQTADETSLDWWQGTDVHLDSQARASVPQSPSPPPSAVRPPSPHSAVLQSPAQSHSHSPAQPHLEPPSQPPSPPQSPLQSPPQPLSRPQSQSQSHSKSSPDGCLDSSLQSQPSPPNSQSHPRLQTQPQARSEPQVEIQADTDPGMHTQVGQQQNMHAEESDDFEDIVALNDDELDKALGFDQDFQEDEDDLEVEFDSDNNVFVTHAADDEGRDQSQPAQAEVAQTGGWAASRKDDGVGWTHRRKAHEATHARDDTQGTQRKPMHAETAKFARARAAKKSAVVVTTMRSNREVQAHKKQRVKDIPLHVGWIHKDRSGKTLPLPRKVKEKRQKLKEQAAKAAQERKTRPRSTFVRRDDKYAPRQRDRAR